MKFTVQVILEDHSGSVIPYDSLCNNDREMVREWIEERLSEMREECGSGPQYGFRGLIESIEVNGCYVYFTMDRRAPNYFSESELQEEFRGEVSDGYLNDCSNDELDDGRRIYFSETSRDLWKN